MKKNISKDSPKVLGLDISTKTIGIALFDIETKQLLELTHISPKPKMDKENKILELMLKSGITKEKLQTYQGLGVTKVVIEEPLICSFVGISIFLEYFLTIFLIVFFSSVLNL